MFSIQSNKTPAACHRDAASTQATLAVHALNVRGKGGRVGIRMGDKIAEDMFESALILID